MGRKIKSKEYYGKRVKELLKELEQKENPVIHTNKNEGIRYDLSLDGQYEVNQCLDENNTYLKDMPPYWFALRKIIDEEHREKDEMYLISCGEKKIRWLRGYQDNEEYWYVFTVLYDEKGNMIQKKKIRLQNLFSNMYPEEAYFSPKAEKLIEEKGVFAFGRAKDACHGHHDDLDNQNNNPNNISGLCDVHTMLHQIDKGTEVPAEDMMQVCEEEFCGLPAVILTRDRYGKNGCEKEKAKKLVTYDIPYYMRKHNLHCMVVTSPETYNSCETNQDREYLINYMNSMQSILNERYSDTDKLYIYSLFQNLYKKHVEE